MSIKHDLGSENRWLNEDLAFADGLISNKKLHIEFANRLNYVRISRAFALLSPLQRHLFRLIPYFFQYHHYRLPGYNGPLVPCGIYQYQKTTAIVDACQTLNIFTHFEPTSSSAVFEGIYAMGSTASFGQNAKSDIDVWLVYDPQLNEHELSQIRTKANLLTEWFAKYKFEVNFYLVNPNQFTLDNEFASQTNINAEKALNLDHSGSCQHWLLLEEFYRTQICLAGKQVAWWPNAEPQEDLLFLGDVHRLPASEYLSAALWHLYKGLGKPHKSLLKVILLEAYSNEFPNTHLISDTLWHQTLLGNFSAGNDPYYLLYQYIEDYLIKDNDLERLKVVRQCFYLKCGIHLTKSTNAQDWRSYKFQELVNKWNWSEAQLEHLNNCENWHSGQLQKFNQQLNKLMLESYKTLLRFASNQKLNSQMRADELGMLSRKLHTYFNQDKDQVLKLNRLWSQNVAEKELILSINNEYCLARFNSKSPSSTEIIHKNKSLASILCWACINGVTTTTTRWFEKTDNQTIPNKNLTTLCKRIRNKINIDITPVSKQHLFNPWHFKQIMLILNLEQDPTKDWLGQDVMVDRMNANILSLGRQQQNMLASIDIIYLNSWGEYHCQKFSGNLCVLEVLSFISPSLRRTPKDVVISVVSNSSKLAFQLEHTVINLVRQTARLCHHAETDTMLLQPLQIGAVRYGIFFTDQGMNWQDLRDTKSLYHQYFKGYLAELPKSKNTGHPLASLPNAIQLYAILGVTQYFLNQRHKDVNVFVIDEKNQLHRFVQKDTNMEKMVANVSHQYVFKQYHSVSERFNMPQFYRLDGSLDAPSVAPFGLVPEQSAHEF